MMSLIAKVNEHNQTKPLIVVGKPGTNKMKKALSFVSDEPIIQYANEFDMPDIFSIPREKGIIIRDMTYKPKTDEIYTAMVAYRGQVVLVSDNQKDVPKKLFNMCKLKRSIKKELLEEIREIAPNSEEPSNYEMDIFPLVSEYLKNQDRDEVATLLKLNNPPDIQMISWLAPNVHPGKLSFVDYSVKRRWSTDYLWELLAYSHDGKMYKKMEMPTRGSYSQMWKICRKIGLRKSDNYLLQSLIKDESFRDYLSTVLNNTERRLLKIKKKTRKKKMDAIKPENQLMRWL